MKCTYFKKGLYHNYCAASSWGIMIPSALEVEQFCTTLSHMSCIWKLQKEREVMHTNPTEESSICVCRAARRIEENIKE
ncbi:MAG: hypothetical protein JW844_00765 [Candidatus Omnitrophica bacterium]|nr:hypothetical protein [Candidatus Omnitrophota bacterium]